MGNSRTRGAKSRWNCHELRASAGERLRSVVAATAKPAGKARNSGQAELFRGGCYDGA